MVKELYNFFARLLIISGIIVIAYSSFTFINSKLNEQKRLKEVKNIVSDDIVTDFSTVNYDFETGDSIGLLYIPRLDREMPIIEGTDEEELAEGVGHYKGTGFPGENKQILLSGHRDTVFREFGKLENGDEFHIRMENGTFIYEIRDHEIVDANDETVIDYNRKDEYLTVSTCYPFSYIGSAPDRYVVYAYPKQ